MRFLKVAKLKALLFARDIFNLVFSRGPVALSSDLPEFNEVLEHARRRSDFSDHLPALFAEALAARPKLIVELGTRGGESTFVFERVARLCDSTLLSVDIEDCLQASSYPAWNFVKSDDVVFAGKFKAWCQKKKIKPVIDLLFIDTSHLYEHTKAEIKVWLPHMARAGKVIFHDTNMQYFYHRVDGSMDIGWDNQRGVIRALEEYLETPLDETQDFITAKKNWLIRHRALCNGFTILERLA
jgi:cephalosporin hydroxylase